MDALIPALLALLKDAPELISFAEQSYQLFTAGTLTQEQLVGLWKTAGTAAKAAEAKWRAAAPPAA